MRKLLFIALAILYFSSIGNGQSRKAFEKEADKAFEKKDYYSALSYYSEMLLFDRDLPTLYKSAESARLFDAYSIAEMYYQETIQRDSAYLYPDAPFYLALMQQLQGKYKEAKDGFRIYISENEGQNDELVNQAKKEEQSCEWAIQQVEHPKKNIEVVHRTDGINTPYSEFGALQSDDGLYFSSLRFSQQMEGEKRVKLFSKILKEDEQSGSITPDSSIETSPNIHAAHTTFNADASMMIYTLCTYLNDKDIRCELYQRKRNRNGSWNEGTRLPNYINSDDSLTTTTMPHITYDEKIDKEILYFVSNKEGGKGGLDIYYSVINENGDFSQPMNLSGINTPQDEVTPFYHDPTNTLFFSSKGYLGLGGFDVYKVYQGGTGWGKVENMGSPINTSYHDLYFTLSENGIDALMSSNRTGSLYLDDQSEACCFDIYDVTILPCDIDLHAYTFDVDTRDSLNGVNIKVTNLSKGSEIIFSSESSEGSHFFVPIDCEDEYKITATKPGYRNAEVTFTAPRAGTNNRIDKLLYLEPLTIRLEAYTFDRLSNIALEGCSVRLFNLSTGEVETSPINKDGNEFYFKVRPCERYELIATREGYTQDQLIFEVPCDPQGITVIRKELYLATGLLDMLPIYLYFDNDRPDRRTLKRTTKTHYSETYDAYIIRKDTFIDQYASAFPDVSGTRADVEMSNFFDNEVKAQYERLDLFLRLLEKELKAGKDYDIVLRGFASPRASSTYNEHLGSRRVDCVKNEFKKYNDGVLIPYIQNKQLRLSEKSLGESEAPPGVSDDLNDLINSVFSPAASQERRVEIVDVKKVKK